MSKKHLDNNDMAKTMSRVYGKVKVTDASKYTAEVQLDNLTYAV
jgi:hypothetical protein